MGPKLNTQLYNTLCEEFIANNGKLSVHDLFTLLRKGMEFVEQSKLLTGIQKKQMVEVAIQQLIECNIVDNPVLRHTLLALLEPYIQTIIEVSQHKWMLNIKKGATCCPFL